eukprot:RCo033145
MSFRGAKAPMALVDEPTEPRSSHLQSSAARSTSPITMDERLANFSFARPTTSFRFTRTDTSTEHHSGSPHHPSSGMANLATALSGVSAASTPSLVVSFRASGAALPPSGEGPGAEQEEGDSSV